MENSEHAKNVIVESSAHSAPQTTLAHAQSDESLWKRSLVGSFAANVLLLSSMSLLFRYSDFVMARGGSELHLGWIVGVGMVGAIVFRIVQGYLIDHCGAQLIWLISLCLFALSLWWHVYIDSVTTLEVYLARLLMVAGISGALGSWLTFVSLQAPAGRVAEVMGVVGSSGFVGMAIGPLIGDLLVGGKDLEVSQVNLMFWCAILLVGLSGICAFIATAGVKRQQVQRGKGIQLGLLRKHHPGIMIFVALAMGLGIVVPQTFLRPYLQSLDIDYIARFFLTYNITAFVFRWVFRKAPKTMGLPSMVTIGLICLGCSMPFYLLVFDSWTLMLPAFFAGLSHAFLFPAVMAMGTERFPEENRGLAINVMFAINEIGVLFGAPLIANVLSKANSLDLPGYTIVFCLLMSIFFVTAITFNILQKSQASSSRTVTT